ncbi:hypothetical protein ACWHA3_12740 [Streptomyces cyaneofuscatus]
MDLELDEGARRLTLLERDHAVLKRSYEEQLARMVQLERRLDAHMAVHARERDDVPSNDHGAHHVIAREYDAFVEQKVQGMVRTVGTNVYGSAPYGVPQLPWLMSRISAVLFGPDEPEAATVLAALGRKRLDPLASQAARLCGTALDLRRRSAQTGLPCQWDFELVPGALLDEEWQQAWPSCDRSLPAQFVIAPAYIVAEQVYSLQRVYTGLSIPV